MKARWRLAILVCATSTYLALPPTAAQAQQLEIHGGGIELRIPLGGRHNYLLYLTAKDDQRVKLSASELFRSAVYSVPGQVSSRHIEGDFGSLGTVDLRIDLGRKLSGRPPLSPNCRGRPSIFFRGTYRGTIEFAGDHDVPAVHSRHGHVVFVHRFRQVCRSPKPAPAKVTKGIQRSELELGVLTASSQGEGRTISFDAFELAARKYPNIAFGVVFALVHERLEEVRVDRSTLSFASGKELVMSKPSRSSETLKVAPEEPFSGKAVFSRSRRSPSTWTGNLAVKLPGARPVALTGPNFSASLCRAVMPARIETCFAQIGLTSRPLRTFRNDFFHSFLTHTAAR